MLPVRVYLSSDYKKPKFQSGWNIISQNTISKILEKHGVKKYTFHPFNISVDIEPKLDDAVRSWTEKLEDGSRYIINGLCIQQPQFILEINI